MGYYRQTDGAWLVEERSADQGPSLSERGTGRMALAGRYPPQKRRSISAPPLPQLIIGSRERFASAPPSNLAVGRRERYVVPVRCWLAEMACCEYVYL